METIKKEPTTTDKTNELVEKIKTAVNTCQLISEDCMVSLIFKNIDIEVIKEASKELNLTLREPGFIRGLDYYYSMYLPIKNIVVEIRGKELKAKTVYE